MNHPIVHFELWSPNPEAASKFYSDLFDWKINYTPALSYWLIDTGASIGAAGWTGGVNGGMFKPEAGPLPAKLTIYVGVDDVGAALKKALAAGGKILIPETEIPGVGWSAVVLDPDERAIGLFKPLPQQAPARPAATTTRRQRPAKKAARPAKAARKPPARRPRSVAAAKKRPAKKK
jgi:predicted enzyme related to lactoylglutathione lyase